MGRLTGSVRALLVAATSTSVAIAAIVVLAGGLSQHFGPNSLGDLEVYKGAVTWAMSGRPLYDWTYQSHPTLFDLGFTYPPFAAVAMSWMAPMDMASVKLIWTILSFLVIIACVWLVVHTAQAGHPSGWLGELSWTSGLLVPVLFAYPMIQNLFVGQASLFIMALALFDHQLPRRWRGVLVGVASAIKLTPLVFIPYFLVTRQWRAAITASGTFVGASAVGFAVLPQASVVYWTDKLWQSGRVGHFDATLNKSLLGILTRLLGDGVPARALWLVLAGAVVAIAFWRASTHFRDGNALGATLVVGTLSVAISPISWPHHLGWLVMMASWWLLQRDALSRFLAVALFAILMIYPAYDNYPSMDPALAFLIEVPCLAVLAVIVIGARRGPAHGVGAEASVR